MAERDEGLSVLIVDDHERTRAVLATLVTRLGIADIDAAADGVAAFELLRQRHFDLILCDYHMSPWDGFELKRRLDDSDLDADLAFVLVTADTDFAVVNMAADAGIDVLIKPFKADALANALCRNLGAERMRQVLA